MRNSLRFASKADWQPITKQLKAIYTAPGLDAAELLFEEFVEKWEAKYPAMIKSWRDTWEDFIPFLEFPPELRKVVYPTNAIESLNARFRKAAVRRGHFPTEQSALKVALSRGDRAAEEPEQPDRADQRLESHPEHAHNSLQRPSGR